MPERDPQPRPIGWWLKEADRRLDAAFDRALGAHGIDRRGWQAFTLVAERPRPTAEVVDALATFDGAGEVRRVVGDLVQRGWLEEAEGVLRPTPAGATAHAGLAARVAEVRDRVRAALPGDDYPALVGLLTRLVDGLDPAP